MRALLLHLGGADNGSCFTVLSVDADDHDADLDAEPDYTDPKDWDAIRHVIQELPWQHNNVGGCGGGILRTGELPRSMCARMASRVRPGALH
jgi:hypothetical protein